MNTATLYSEKIPKLRFNDFNDEWKNKSVNELASKLNVGFVGTCEPFYTNSSEGILLIRTGNLKGVNIILDEEKYVTKEFHNKNKKSQIYPGDLLLARHGGNGEICMVPKEFPTANCLNIVILRTNSNLDSGFFQLAYSSYSVQEQINSVTAGSTQGVINTKEIGKLDIVFPSLPEQQKIASFLSAVDEKIQQLSRKKELLKQYKKGVMQQLFSGKLRFKDEDGKDYEDWEEKKLGDILKIGSGRDYKHLDEGQIPVFGTGGYMLSVNKFLHSGETVFIGRKGTIDKPFYFNGEFWTVDTLFYTHTFKNVTPKFIYCVFQQINWKLHNEASGVPSLSKSTIEKLKFDFPCIEEQQKIANFLSSIDTKIESVNKQLAQTQTFKKGLLQQMFV